jgi:hypothetical protein
MKMPTPIETLLLLLCAIIFASCAEQSDSASGKNLKLQTIANPMGGPPTFVYRQQPADQ